MNDQEKLKEKVKSSIVPVLENILDDFYDDEDLQKIDFKNLLLSVAIGVISHYTSRAIDACYEIFKEEVLPIITETNRIEVDSENEQKLFIASYNAFFDAAIDEKSLKIIK